jgi:hypothetical protein
VKRSLPIALSFGLIVAMTALAGSVIVSRQATNRLDDAQAEQLSLAKADREARDSTAAEQDERRRLTILGLPYQEGTSALTSARQTVAAARKVMDTDAALHDIERRLITALIAGETGAYNAAAADYGPARDQYDANLDAFDAARHSLP